MKQNVKVQSYYKWSDKYYNCIAFKYLSDHIKYSLMLIISLRWYNQYNKIEASRSDYNYITCITITKDFRSTNIWYYKISTISVSNNTLYCLVMNAYTVILYNMKCNLADMLFVSKDSIL